MQSSVNLHVGSGDLLANVEDFILSLQSFCVLYFRLPLILQFSITKLFFVNKAINIPSTYRNVQISLYNAHILDYVMFYQLLSHKTTVLSDPRLTEGM